jgi:acyl transferase domain-containing protein/acyl carrier protein/SAM-dependent methyltransferase
MISYAQKLRTLRPASAPVPAGLEQQILGLLATTLGVERTRVSAAAPFAELGLSSLLGVRFLDAVNREFSLRLGVESLFAHNTVAALATYLAELVPSSVPDPVPAARPAMDSGIAVIGMAGRFPGADTVAALWEALAAGQCLVREVPPERWSSDAFYSPDPAVPGRSISKWAGFLDGIDRFDAGFFNISPREAAAMDPQHRLFLEQAWLAFENAGYPAERLKGSETGVFLGASGSGYEAMLEPDVQAAQSYGLTGNLVSLMAARIAYALDLRGPALVVDTACSASLVALDLACQALERGEIGMALVGGVSLFLDEKPFLAMTRTGMLSPDGRCHTFDAGANGIAVGEAAAAVVLKPLARALADGDRVDAVIRASGTNQDGRSNGITAPNPAAQTTLLRRVHARAAIDPATLTYVEAHGTGTPLGDPVEVAALRDAIGTRPADAVPCALGAVKSNLGHTAEAAGLVGLIKTVLCLQHREIVPSINFAALNPKIDPGQSGLVVATERRPWVPAAGAPRRAAVSAFGLSGTNAHVVLEEAPAAAPTIAAAGPQLLLVSARDADALGHKVADLAAWLRGPGAGAALADVAATLALGRSHFDHRLTCIASTVEQAADKLMAGETMRAMVPRDAVTTMPEGADPEAFAAAYLRGAMPEKRLWAGAKRNVALPGYPFRGGVHWAARRPTCAPPQHPLADGPGEVIHHFRPDEPLVRDHTISGTGILHAALFLEMARLAASRARGGASVAELRDIAWERTLRVPAEGLIVRIATEPAAGAVICALNAGEALPAARCNALFAQLAPPDRLDLTACRAECDRHATRQELDALDRGAVRLGPSFSGFDELWVGQTIALSRVEPDPGDAPYSLPPRLMDAAIQTGAALLAQSDGPALQLRYPASVDSIAILAPAGRARFILARQTGPDRVDITVTDAEGAPCLVWTGFTMRAAGARPEAVPQPRTMRPAWLARALRPGPAAAPSGVIGNAGLAHTLGVPDLTTEMLDATAAPASLIFADHGEAAVGQLLHLVRGLLARGHGTTAIDLRVVTGPAHRISGHEALDPDAAAVQGLAKAVARECPAWRVAIIDIDPAAFELRDAVLDAVPSATGEPAAWRDGVRYERILEPVEDAPGAPVLREGGTYLLLGGTGRVGRNLARHLAANYRARLLLIGRKPLDSDRNVFLAGLRELGGEAEYHALDIAAPGALAAVLGRVGRIDGVIQAVVDPLFARLEQTDEVAFGAALRPKIAGFRALAETLGTLRPDFVAIFSSIGAYAGFPGNVGQASYCAACCFEESFAAVLGAAGVPVRLIQWGLWEHEAFAGEGLERLRRQGIQPMRTPAAIRSFERILAAPERHVVHASLSDAVWQAMGALASPDPAFSSAATALQRASAGAQPADVALHLAVDAYARALTTETLRARNLLPNGDHWSEAEFRARCAVRPRHAALFDAVTELLRRPATDPPTRAALLARAPSLREPLDLLELCVAALPDVLNGERDGTDILFPGGSMQRVEAIYRNQPVLAACNTMLAQAVAAARPKTILEIGAGTGATSAAVLEALPAGGLREYRYTDISPGFLRHARQHFDDARLHFATLDIERDPAEQGFSAAQCDVVIATNVLHATRDIHATLRHAAHLLRPGGLLVLNEMTVAEDFATLTFGLLDGWWHATDPARRMPHSPLLDVSGWRTWLRAAGFDHVVAVPAPGYADAAASPQTVLLAQKEATPSIVRAAPPVLAATPAPAGKTPPVTDIEEIVRAHVAAGLDMAPEAIDPETPFAELGVDSIVAPQIAEAINRASGIALRSTDLYNFATARTLAAHIAEAFPEAACAPDPVPPGAPAALAGPAQDDALDEAIAIVGMAGRFPDAPDLARFWDNIAAGRSAVREIERFDITPFYAPERGQPGKTYAKWAALLEEHDRFDPLFFSISPAEAEAMDPQQRLLLEEAWHALEDAGATPQSLDGRQCGVFIGASANSYAAPAAPSLQTLGGSMAILSARLSYFLNLKGPTFPVDTGCSSSLVALHLACQSLRTGESEIAIAGGVSCNLLAPPIFLYLSDAGMASPEGRCKTFDDSADGFAPGEGVGVVVLKRLADARRDGDRVHALVRGTGINQDGRTSGLTAPSATSQTELECAVYRQAGIDPSSIGLVEAHGTGTRLGDPIEVAALTDAFARFTPAKQFCAIGSVKSNVGHAMAAAGMAGLLKAVQALRHRMLPATLNFRTPNRHINFADSPFVVNTETKPWESAGVRRAAVSSFGFSGTNAHVVLEEAAPAFVPAAPSAGPFLFVVSARTEAALARRITDLAAALRQKPDLSPADIAYTLAKRRAHFRHRQAFLAGSVAELVAMLAGEIPTGTNAAAQKYREGGPVELGFEGRLVDLPLYPFERERFWHEQSPVTPGRPDLAALAGSWVMRDHVVRGRSLLPGAAFLELARAAVLGEAAETSLRDLLWSAPAEATQGDPGLVIDQAAEAGGTRCTLRGHAGAHASGLVGAVLPDRPPPLDLAKLGSRCTQRREGAAIYSAAAAHGFAYGPAYRRIERVGIGIEEAISELDAPADPADWVLHPALLDAALQTAACIGLDSAAGEQPAYVPFALDAFTAYAPIRDACRVHARRTSANGALMTFDITICAKDGAVLATLHNLQARALAAVEQAASEPAASETAETLLFVPAWREAPAIGERGTGVVIALADDGAADALREALPGRRLVQVTPGSGFDRIASDRFTIEPASEVDYQRLLADLEPGADATILHLWALGPCDTAVTFADFVEAMDADTGLRALFLLTKAALRMPNPGDIRILVGADPAEPFAAAAAGFARSLGQESSQLSCRVVQLAREDVPLLAREIDANPDAAEIALHGGTRLVRSLDPLDLPAAAQAQEGGVFVITGGLGGIGLAVARHLARTRRQPRLVLMGRGAPDDERVRKLAEIEAVGADILTLRTDVASGAAVSAALAKARRRFGPITGVIHAAGVLRDARLAVQDPADLDAVLAAKLHGALTLDHHTREDPLAFFALFSSTAASFGSAGQAAYAAANGFLDGFAAWRAAQNRPGRTVSVAWPLWQSGGMAPPAEIAAELERRMGMLPMPDAGALAVLDRALVNAPPRMVALHGRGDALRRFVAATPEVATASRTEAVPILREAVEDYLKTVLAGVTRLAPQRIDSTERFEAYGVDSMMIVKMNATLERELGELPKTLFFEFQTVRDLAGHLMAAHSGVLAKRFAPPSPPPQADPASRAPSPVQSAEDAIAIIGIAGLYPKANDLDQFWANLSAGRDCIVEIPAERWPLEGFYDPDRERPETSYSKWGGFIDGADQFDARFFNITPREADSLDPQARKFLEIAWATMEDAGRTRETLFRGDADPALRLGGVFVGVMYGDYQLFGPEEAARGNLIAPNAAYWNVANRVSNVLDLHGPSMAVDTACSSSLTAIHMACSAIRNGDCTLAFAGGVNLTIHPNKHWILSKSGFASTDGRCRSFGAGGDGYVPGEGVGAVLLKPLSRAIADGDRIHAVIRSSAVNHGGRTNGYTVPNPVAQGQLVSAALARADVPAASISYIEAHGTGTALGDPVEIAGLTRAFAGVAPGSVPVGSVKSNIGHLESAAGIAAVTKVVLQMRHAMLAPSLHAEALNPNLSLATTPFSIQREATPWLAPPDLPRRAGISSFGAGGSNAHVVLEEAPTLPAAPPRANGALLVPLSAATQEALVEHAARLADWLDTKDANTADFAAIVRTLQTGREAMRHRVVLCAVDHAELTAGLRALAAGKTPEPPPEGASWAAGGPIDWDAHAPGPRPPVSMPTYPFARRRCWITQTARAPQTTLPGAIACPADAPLVADHRFGGETVLAGAFLLHAAWKADGRTARGMQDIRFLRPVRPGMRPVVAFEPEGGFTIEVDGVAHASGVLADAVPTVPDLDLLAIEARCQEHIGQKGVYAALDRGGAQYGPAYRLITDVMRGQGEALAQLAAVDNEDSWPAANLLDAAFQLSFAVAEGGMMPFTIDRLSVLGPPNAATRAYARRVEFGAGFLRLDLRLCDDTGRVLVAMDGFVARAAAPALPLRLLGPAWSPVPLPVKASDHDGSALVLGDGPMARAIAKAWPGQHAAMAADFASADADEVWFLAGWETGESEADAAGRLLGLVKAVAARPRPPKLTILTAGANAVRPGEAPAPVAAAVAAFAKSVAHEHPDLPLRIVDTDPQAEAADLLRLPGDPGELVLRDGSLWRRHFVEMELPETAMPWRRGGTYLIAGGAGGIGLALATHLVQSAGARVALLGRREQDEALREQIAAIGGEVLYLKADVTDAGALTAAVAAVRARFGAINGAFHLALAMHDARAVTLTTEQLRAVLAPKITGTRNLIAALRKDKLDALVLFSSSNAHTANPGQSAYAAASAAQDAIGLQPAPWPVKVIDWGFWGEAGRVATPQYHESLARLGVFPIGTREGFATMERLLASPVAQLVPLRVSQAVANALGVRSAGPMEAIAKAVAPSAAAGVAMVERAAQAFAGIDAYAAGRLLLTLQAEGVLQRAGEEVGDLAARLGGKPHHAKLMAALGDMLARTGFLGEDKVTPAAIIPQSERSAALGAQRAEWVSLQPEVAPYLELLDACTANLIAVLRGEMEATDVLFPGGSMARVEPIYRGNQVVDHFQSVLAEAAAAAARARLATLPPGETLQIIEIGAGTGGTTAFALPALAPYAARIRYVFTDIGRPFLDAARKRFAEYGFLAVEHFDTEQPPEVQGFARNGFDIVIAANVLHATRDIAATLDQVRALCRPGGVLLVNEATARQDFNTLTFGLTPGWWLFEDDAQRLPHAPLLDASSWVAAFTAHGFSEARVLAGGALQSVFAVIADEQMDEPARAASKPRRSVAGSVEEILRATVAKSLRLAPEEVEPDTSFAEYGADSIISVDLVREINAALGIELKTTALFNYATVRALAGYIEAEFPAEASAPAKAPSRARERSERLREIIRKRRGEPLPPDPAHEPSLDEDAAMLALLRRLQAGEIRVADAMTETTDA